MSLSQFLVVFLVQVSRSHAYLGMSTLRDTDIVCEITVQECVLK